MDPLSVVRAYLAHSSPDSVARDITSLVMPYLFVLEARAERAGTPDPSLPTRLLYEYILTAPLDLVAAIFDASKPTLPTSQRIIKNDEDMAKLALACLYASDSLTEWPTMSSIFECLPVWDVRENEDPNDEAALNRRAARFQREHEIERRKQNALPHRQFANLSISRSNTPSSSSWFGDEPEGDPVCLLSLSVFPSLLHALRRLD